MNNSFQQVQIYGVQDRRSTGKTRPWVVRWSVDGPQKSRAFRTKAEAERFRSLLLQAVHNGERFDSATCEPAPWSTPFADMTVYEWAQQWLGQEWGEWQPRTRTSAVESLAKFVMLTANISVGKNDADLRRHLKQSLRPGAKDLDPKWEKWLASHSIPVRALDRPLIADVDRRLGLRLDGTQLAATTTSRTRIVCRACVEDAVEAGALTSHPWPKRATTRARRKVNRRRPSVDRRKIPSPEVMARAIDAIANHQPGSRMYRAMTAVAYYAGLRPSEVVMLRIGSLDLPVDGFGRVYVVEADIDFDEPGEPKTGPRDLPIPPELVAILREWIDERQLSGKETLLFRTSGDRRPAQSNWTRTWHRALRSIGEPPMRVYDCRHAAATGWIAADVSGPEVARRLGHSLQTLVSVYVGIMETDEAEANAKIALFLRGGVGR